MPPLSLYLHIPFCQRKCPYCDFNTYAGREGRYEAYARALAADLRRAGLAMGRPEVPTVFLGGGTPTVLESEQLQTIFAGLRDGFRPLPLAEITSEANPGAVDQSRFERLRRLGVNRLSMGVQSFAGDELRFLGRIHSAGEAEEAFGLARRAGFDNINLDFMFGLPGQRPETWRRTLDQALDLGPEHLSLYSLIVEPETPLADWVASGRVPDPDPDLAADLYELACERLQAAGYEHYEISNWARGPLLADGLPAYACRHNLVYWRNQPYLGFGPGAHSWWGGKRWSVGRSVEHYIRAAAVHTPPHDYEEDISPALAMGETMMVGLRLLGVGVEREPFRQRFGREVAEVWPAELAELAARGLIEISDERVRLTQRGWLLGNQVFGAFLPEV
ncbi:MAG: radical SAM family heme chaperone HemW [Caldilineales bacterium]|nr:radical SAM family heme chaperone HemW [Caldilineales bacterium]